MERNSKNQKDLIKKIDKIEKAYNNFLVKIGKLKKELMILKTNILKRRDQKEIEKINRILK